MTCSRVECGGAAKWHPMLQFRPPASYRTEAFIPAILGLVLCDACRQNAKVEDFVSPQIQEVILKLAEGLGMAKPDLSLTTLGWEPFDSKYSKAIRKKDEDGT